jgi:hypothetical protein
VEGGNGGPGPDRRGTAWAARQQSATTAWAAQHGPHGGVAGVDDAWAPTGNGRERERRGGVRGPSPKE